MKEFLHKVPDMEPQDIIGKYKTTVHTYTNNSRRIVLYTDIETTVPEGQTISSITDTRGIITHVNSALVNISGYTKEELMGAPHCLLRHPDMPRAAFQDMWDTLKTKGRWAGCVKNLRKDGGYYWVKASVIVLRRNGEVVGYTSSRVKPSNEEIETHKKLYNIA